MQLEAFFIVQAASVTTNNQELHISEPRINDRIRVPEVRLVGPAGEQVGIVRIEDALRLATESDLDLVEVAPQAKPPVCKLMDFGKYKYEAAVKAREARKNQTNTVLKEIRFRLKIDTHDYDTKTGHARRFLAAGDKVKAMIQFRGREQQRPEMGIRLLQKFADDVSEVGLVESSPRIDGRNMVMVIGPTKNKAEAKAEARRSAQRTEAKALNDAKKRVDESGDGQPLTQTIGDQLSAELAKKSAETPVVEAEVPTVEAEPKDIVAEKPSVTADAPTSTPETVPEEKKTPKAKDEEAATPESVVEKSVPEKSAAEKTTAAKPAAGKSGPEKPAAEKTTAAKAAAEKPVAAKPVAKTSPSPAPKPAPKAKPAAPKGKPGPAK
ncbi:translation initiation factor IF-3 [Arthrobacter roseus]|uniref:translation initiation factor IF-3 n=1 Tax=Arthrobacter roseus TaxID=136274 RepID=UPI001965C40D|nr:translation initiation factor IF-3 [Arthrobacter roseus]MBM7848257.1 translation initiation factor IF-3 [Arthrobacter roseus]